LSYRQCGRAVADALRREPIGRRDRIRSNPRLDSGLKPVAFAA